LRALQNERGVRSKTVGEDEFGAVDAVGFGGIDDGRGVGGVFHVDDKISMGECAGRGISGAVCLVFRGMRGFLRM
jgi:hypothetical protein